MPAWATIRAAAGGGISEVTSLACAAGLRHSHRTHLEELRTKKVLMDERKGRSDSSVSARYAHVADAMRQRLLAGLPRALSSR